MTRPALGVFALFAAVLGAAGPAAAQRLPPEPQPWQRPNLIVIIVDEWCVHSMRGPHWPNDYECFTPVLERLSSGGVCFTNFRPARRDGEAGGADGRAAPPPAAAAPGLHAFAPWQQALAEMLRTKGYYVVEVDSTDLAPARAGFIVPRFSPGFEGRHADPPRIIVDAPREIGDEEMTSAVLVAQHRIMYRAPEHAERPYALFFRLSAPTFLDDQGQRIVPAGGDGYRWPRLDPRLCPFTWHEYGSTHNVGPPEKGGDAIRFLQYTEARDSAIGHLLGRGSLSVIDEFTGDYQAVSHTVVCLLSLSAFDRSVFITRPEELEGPPEPADPPLPLLFLGEGVAGAKYQGLADGRPVNLADVAQTLCDLVGASAGQREALRACPGGPGRSLGDALGITPGSEPEDESP